MVSLGRFHSRMTHSFMEGLMECISFQENSFCHALGHMELDLPEAPEKAPRPPLQPADPFSKYGPKAEISHIFRAPEKRPPENLSLAFLVLTLMPFLGFLVGVRLLAWVLLLQPPFVFYLSKLVGSSHSSIVHWITSLWCNNSVWRSLL